MFCDVTSAVTELMVRVLHTRGGAIGIHDVAGVEASIQLINKKQVSLC